MMVKFGERIRALADSIGKDEQDVAKDLGLTKSRLSHYISGRSKVPSELLQKIVDVYKINPLFLFDENSSLYQSDNKEMKEKISGNDYNYFPTPISAGLPFEVDGITEASKISISDEVLGKYANDKDIFFTRANGDSMNNLFDNGSLLAVKPINNKTDLSNGDIVVYSKDGDYSVMHYHKYGDTLVYTPYSTTNHKEHEYNIDDGVQVHGQVVTYIVNLD